MTEIEDEAVLLPLLLADRRWAAYGLGDLDPPYRQQTRIFTVRREVPATAAIMFYELPGTTALLPFGDPDGVALTLRGLEDLPESVFLVAHPQHLAVVETRYGIDDRWPMLRMALEPAGLQPADPAVLPVRRLTVDESTAIQNLYRPWTETFFDPLMLRSGVYFGAHVGENLIAVAGTHVLSRRFRVAAIGGVFTHPEYRGRGLATSTTHAVAQALADADIDTIVLNVREDNLPAIAAYNRLGFGIHVRYWEGRATIPETGDRPVRSGL